MPKSYAISIVFPADTPSGLTPPLVERTLSLIDETATSVFGAALAQAARALGARPVQVWLSGDLGAGRTMLSRAILRGLEHIGRVRSPTYALIESYDVVGTMGTQKVYYFDLYRFADPEEWTNAGFRDCLAESALCLVEWPEKAQAPLGMPDLHIALSVDVVHETCEDGVEHALRVACLSARTQAGLRPLQSSQYLFPC